MQSLKRPGRTAPKRPQLVAEPEPEGVEPDAFDGEELDDYDTFEMFRVICPDCAQPIALLADEEILPEHALCKIKAIKSGNRVKFRKPSKKLARFLESACAIQPQA